MGIIDYTKEFSLLKHEYIALGFFITNNSINPYSLYEKKLKAFTIKDGEKECRKSKDFIHDLKLFRNDDKHSKEIKDYRNYLKDKIKGFLKDRETQSKELEDPSKYYKCKESILKSNPNSIISKVITKKGYYEDNWVKDQDDCISYEDFIKGCSAGYISKGSRNIYYIGYKTPGQDPFGGHSLVWKVIIKGDYCYIKIDYWGLEG